MDARLSIPDLALVVNGRARRGREWFSDAVAALERRGFRLERAVLAHSSAQFDAAAADAIEAGVPVVALGGGDGTFSRAVPRFVGADTAMGVLPFGTGNAFARDLGIPADVEGAADVLAGGRVAKIDLGEVSRLTGVGGPGPEAPCPFLNIATVGLTTRIAEWLQPAAKRRYGRAVYLLALLRAVAVTRPFYVELTTGEGSFAFHSLQVVIGNGRYHAGPFPLHPDASITEGKLHVYALRGRRKASFVRLAWHLRTGRHVDLDEVFALETAGGDLVARPSKRVTVDGEIRLRTPIRFDVRPGALRAVVPDAFPG